MHTYSTYLLIKVKNLKLAKIENLTGNQTLMITDKNGSWVKEGSCINFQEINGKFEIRNQSRIYKRK